MTDKNNFNAPNFRACLKAFPCVAILRGLEPDIAEETGELLFDAGFRIIEVPLNSPRPLESIALLAAQFKDRAIIGAGTVLSMSDVEAVQAAGGQIIVSPNSNLDVIRHTKSLGLLSAPGVQTPTEAFAAIDAGADCLKFFPGEAITPTILKAMKAVLPPDMPCLVVGGVTPEKMAAYFQVGATGFGVGSAVFKVGDAPQDVALKAQAFKKALIASAVIKG